MSNILILKKKLYKQTFPISLLFPAVLLEVETVCVHTVNPIKSKELSPYGPSILQSCVVGNYAEWNLAAKI